MQIEMKRLSELTPYDKNAKKHDEKQIANVANSIKRFGWQQPIVIDENGVIVIGHCRALAAKKLGLKEVPVTVASGLTDEEIKELRIADNKTNESPWDLGLLAEDIEGLDFEGFEFVFDDVETGGGETTENIVEDNFDGELPAQPKAKLGDVYQLGNHRLMCGDSTSITDVEKLMGGEKADMVFTDPPYGYNYQSNMREKTKKFDVIENDDKILDFFPNIQMVCNGFVFICTTWKVLDKWLPLFQKYHSLTNMIIWNKGGGGIGDLKHTFATDYEVILCSNNGREITGKRIGSVWTIDKDYAGSYIHPTQKPVKLSEFAIRNTTRIGDCVLDLFGGSGSTLIACEQMQRKCCMMEYDPRYVDVIIDRWEEFTGEKAQLISE